MLYERWNIHWKDGSFTPVWIPEAGQEVDAADMLYKKIEELRGVDDFKRVQFREDGLTLDQVGTY